MSSSSHSFNPEEKIIQSKVRPDTKTLTTLGSMDQVDRLFFDTLRQGLTLFRRDDFLYDLEIVVEGRHFRCHKVILSLFSDFFKSMFSSGMKECEENEIELKSVNADAFESVLSFMYSGEITGCDLFEMLTTSLYFQITSLSEICQKKLIEQLDRNQVLDIWRFTKSNELECEILLNGCEVWLLSNFKMFSESDEFDNLSADELQFLLSSDCLAVSDEEQVYRLAVKWFQHDQNREQHLKEIFQHVRFPLVKKPYLEYVRKSFPSLNNGSLGPFQEKARIYHDNPARQCDINTSQTEPRRHSGLDKGLVILSGCSSMDSVEQSRKVWFYSFVSKAWYRLPDLPHKFGFGFATCTYGQSYIYICGGHESTCCYRYNGQGKLNKWKKCRDLVQERVGHSLIAVNKSIFAIGGMQDDYREFLARRTLKSIEKYNRRSKPWKICGKLRKAVVDAAVTAVGSIIYIFGGSPLDELLPVQSFDVDTKTSSFIQNLQRLDKVLSVGSGDNTFIIDKDKTLQKFSHEKLELVDSIPDTKNTNYAVVKYGQRVYFLGGEEHSNIADDIYEYNTETSEFKTFEQKLPQGLYDFGCHVVIVKKQFYTSCQKS